MMKVIELFDPYQGNGFELINMDIDDVSSINFVARTSENNGIVASVKKQERATPFPAGNISVALGGSVLSAFVQNRPFYTGFHIMVLQPKKPMTLEEKLFYCHAIKMNAYRYGYGRQANKTLKDIELPELPHWLKSYRIDYSPIVTKNKEIKKLPDINIWKEFRLRDLFTFKRGKGITTAEIEENSGSIPCVQSGETNNGIIGYMNDTFLRDSKHAYIKAPFLSLARSGTSGVVNIQNKDCYIGDSVYALKLKNKENLYLYAFLSAILNKERYRYAYGHKVVIETYIDKFIKLPTDKSGCPDWAYMESYIKSLPHGDNI
jgi:restriction endonuclease S subunit